MDRLDGNKLELSGIMAKQTQPPPETYKSVPESDDPRQNMLDDEEAAATATRPKSLVAVAEPQTDGAHEKMLPADDQKIADNSQIGVADVRISFNEKQNGDAKLDIGEIKSAFVGLTKEELMKYANDPFWIRLRWFLFITFWLLWAAMLVGAVLIIYAAPKCSPPPPRTWWEQGLLVDGTADNPNQIMTTNEMQSLTQKGVQGIIAKLSNPYQELNTTTDIVQLIQKAKQENLQVIVQFDPNHKDDEMIQQWFEKSNNVQPNSIYGDYFIWKSSATSGGVPNNWESSENTSAWILSTVRNSYYYSRNGQPQLNFRNQNVTDQLSSQIIKLLDYGANGIRLEGARYLLVDSTFKDEPIDNRNVNGDTHGSYGFNIHSKTENVVDLGLLLKQWRDIVKNKTDNGPFMIAEDLNNIEAYQVNASFVVDLPLESHLFTRTDLTPIDIKRKLYTAFNTSGLIWPLWKYNTSGGILDIVTYLLPGTPLIDRNANVTNELLKIRERPSIMRGNCNYYVASNGSVFVFVRVSSGNPGIVVAFNPTNERAIVNFPKEIPDFSEEVTFLLFSKNYNESDVVTNAKQDSRTIPISAQSTIVLSYVPAKK